MFGFSLVFPKSITYSFCLGCILPSNVLLFYVAKCLLFRILYLLGLQSWERMFLPSLSLKHVICFLDCKEFFFLIWLYFLQLNLNSTRKFFSVLSGRWSFTLILFLMRVYYVLHCYMSTLHVLPILSPACHNSEFLIYTQFSR